MRLFVPLLALGILFAVVAVSAGFAYAQSQPKTYGGGYVQGHVYGYNMWDELIPIDWAEVSASNELYSFKTWSYSDGGYGMFLPTGSYNVTVEEPGFKSQSMIIAVSDGSATTGLNFFLERANVPIPEFPTQLISVVMVLAVAGALMVKRAIRRRR